MTSSPAEPLPELARPPRPVRTGRYRYSRLRWRVLVFALDFIGTIAMALWRLIRKPRRIDSPRRILLVQLDHLGDAVLTSPLIEALRSAYPRATIDVLASASNYEVFAADPKIARVRLAERSWFERRRGRWALLSAVWSLGRSLRGSGYELGIDVRGDILSVLVLTLAGIPRRVGWAMGGGGFLLTDVAHWVPGRHEVLSRLALLDPLGVVPDGPARVSVHVSDLDRVAVSRLLHEAWPEQNVASPATVVRTGAAGSQHVRSRPSRRTTGAARWDEPDDLHAGRFGEASLLLAVHLGAGTGAKRWPPGRWRELVGRFLADGWRVVVVGGPDDFDVAHALAPHDELRDLTGRLSVTQTTALLERADLFIGADSGPSHLAASAGTPSVILFSGTNRMAQWRPWSRRSLVIRERVNCSPCHRKICPLASHPCMAGIDAARVHRAAGRWWARLHRGESAHAD